MEKDISHNMKLIMKYLKTAGYSIDNWNIENVQAMLVSPSSSRTELLFWVLSIFKLSYTFQEQRSFNSSVINKIVNDLAAIGIGKPQDGNLINGSASEASQILFWRRLLEFALRLKSNLKLSLNQKADAVIQNVINSSYYEDSMKDQDLNLLPKDLQLQYKNWKKTSHRRQRIAEIEEKIQKERQVMESMQTPDDKIHELNDLAEKISSLSTQSRAFVATYDSSLSPWCKGANLPPTDVSQEIDHQIVDNCFNQFQRYEKSVALAATVDTTHDLLSQKMTSLEHGKTLSISTILNNVINS